MYKLILYTHITFGGVALLSGITSIISTKGSLVHKKAGKIYYLCMYIVAISALIMSGVHFNPFLLSIAIFALYLTISGKRAIDMWRLREPYSPGIKDKLPVYIGFVTSIFMILFPIYMYITKDNTFLFILSVFGVIMFFNTLRDLRIFRVHKVFEPRNKKWLIKHIGMMCGAYISTVTAFLVNTVHIEPSVILWLGPTLIGGIFITVSINKWNKKLKLN